MAEEWHGQIVDGHLGGYVPGGDPNTTYPTLWRWLVDQLEVRSVLDVGCGDGRGALSTFRTAGARVLGIDGMPSDDPDVLRHDFTEGAPWDPDAGIYRFDLCWSAEFVEHVEERYLPHYLAAFQACEIVLMTHAVPGQGGWHHVNLKPADYWIGAMAAIGYRLDDELTGQARALATDCPGGYSYFAATGLAFRRWGLS